MRYAINVTRPRLLRFIPYLHARISTLLSQCSKNALRTVIPEIREVLDWFEERVFQVRLINILLVVLVGRLPETFSSEESLKRFSNKKCFLAKSHGRDRTLSDKFIVRAYYKA